MISCFQILLYISISPIVPWAYFSCASFQSPHFSSNSQVYPCDWFQESDFRVVSRFLSRRFHPKSRRLFPFYFSNITFRTDLLTFGVTGAVFKIAGEMRRLPAYFDNPADLLVMVVLCLLQLERTAAVGSLQPGAVSCTNDPSDVGQD